MRRAFTALAAIVTSSVLPATACAGIGTRAEVYRAFSDAGRPALPVSHARGSCFSGAIATPRRDAWRCTVGNEILDPCFSTRAAAGIVVCPAADLRHGVEIRLTKSLPRRYANHRAPSLALRPWELVLSGAVRCEFLTGATDVIGHDRLNYGCNPGLGLWGTPSRASPRWTIFAAPYSAHRLHVRRAITRAWF